MGPGSRHRFLASVLRVATLLCIGAFSHSAFAGDADRNRLIAAKTLKCNLGTGVVTTWKNGVTSASNSIFAAGPFYFDAINLKTGTAHVIGKIGNADVTVMTNAAGITFIESKPTYTGATTVFFSGAEGNKYLVVDYRYGAVKDTAYAEYYSGTCNVMR